MVGPRKTIWLSVGANMATQAARAYFAEHTKVTGAHLPWVWIGVAALAFLAGQVVQDFYNPGSWIWANWRALNRCVATDFAAITEPSPNLQVPKIRLRAVRDLKNFHLVGRGHSCSHTARPATQVIFARRQEAHVAKGEPIDVIVGEMHIPHPGWEPKNGGWSSPTGESEASLIRNSDNVIELEIKAGLRRQRLRFYLRVDDSYEPLRTRMKILREEIDLFDPAPHKVRLGWAE